MNWDDLRVFIAIAREKGLKKAALRLQMHHTSCARRIKILEADLGTKLFDRLSSGYVLTSAGEELMLSAQKIQDQFNGIENELLGKDTSLEGDICLTIPNGFALKLLMPDISDFMKLYPALNVELNMTYSFRDLARREADIAIRLANNPPESLSGKRICRVYGSAYASKKYLENHDPVNDPLFCRWLGWGKPENHLNWAGKSGFPEIPVIGDMYSDVLQLEAAKTEIGIASLPCYIGDPDPELVRLPGAEATPTDWLWILAHKDMMSNARVRIFMDFLYQSFRTHIPLIEGHMKGAK